MYMLEIQQYDRHSHHVYRSAINDRFSYISQFKHIGYVSAVFKSKDEACKYYNENNKHMRNLNAHNTYVSDWDPRSKLRYVVRTYQKQ